MQPYPNKKPNAERRAPSFVRELPSHMHMDRRLFALPHLLSQPPHEKESKIIGTLKILSNLDPDLAQFETNSNQIQTKLEETVNPNLIRILI